ncbi:MAG: lipoprotein signal peptidase, partial [Cyclobacteriaceae bacterium]
MRAQKYFLVALAVILIDQTSKLLVHNYMYIHEEINVIGEWFKLHYLLNPGMAFGLKWDNEFGKLALTVFRIGAMVGIGYYLYRMTLRKMHPGFLFSMALILGGAVGNVIDSTFYGVLLDNQPLGSYTPWFHGQVIDMLFFPLFEFYWPDWMPVVGGEYFMFFSPVFNIADSSIFIGVTSILVFQKRFFKETKSEEGEEEVAKQPEDNNVLISAEGHVMSVPVEADETKKE